MKPFAAAFKIVTIVPILKNPAGSRLKVNLKVNQAGQMKLSLFFYFVHSLKEV